MSLKDFLPKQKDRNAIGIAIIFLLLSLLSIWITQKKLDIQGDFALTALLFVPTLVYVIASDKIRELKGPGGLEAKFNEAANAPVSLTVNTIEPSVEEIDIVVKQGASALQNMRNNLNERRPTVMLLELGKSYQRAEILRYIEFLTQLRNFKFVVFVGNDRKFEAYTPQWALKELLTIPQLGDEFIRTVTRGDLKEILKYPGVVKETLSTKTTNAEALRKMVEQRLDAMVVVDGDGRLKGIVEREQILSQMMLALIGN